MTEPTAPVPAATPTEDAVRAGVVSGFSALYGYEPDGLWSAPGRVNLIGEHTDYNEGFVFPFAIDRRTVLALALRQDRRIRISSAFSDTVIETTVDDVRPETLSGWSAYPLGVAWALGNVESFSNADEGAGVDDRLGADLDTVPGFDVFLDSTVPIGAGLSSSAAIESAMALALNDVWELGLDRQTLAKVGQLAENQAVGAPTGIMDQSASLLGRRDAAVFLDCRSLDAEVIDLGFAEAGLALLIIDTNVSHSHATGGYAERRASCEEGAAVMGVPSLRYLEIDDLPRAEERMSETTFRRVRHIVTENQRVLDTVRTLRLEGPGAIGPLLDASHVSMRDDFEISVPELDLAVETAQANGAIGARMTGGGFGGAAIALVPSATVPALETAILAAFAGAGFATPTMFVVNAADGAKRESLD
ncbi:MAG: galactokinase [Glaciihabitans sp.]|nr:galactokinase [Glaciihabitans sp.]